MFRRFVAPILRILAFFAILLLPLALAALADAAEPADLVTLRSVTLAERPGDRWPAGARLSASQPAHLLERQGAKVLLEAQTPRGRVMGWADQDAVFSLDDPAVEPAQLADRGRVLLAQGDRPVLAGAFLSAAARRAPKSVEAWQLLGEAGEKIAQAAHPSADGGTPVTVTLAARWGVMLVRGPKGWRYDGAAYRALVALAPPGPLAEEARLKLLACGPQIDLTRPDLVAAGVREKDLAEFLASFPESPKRQALLFERARLLSALAEGSARQGHAEEAMARRDAAIEAASEIAASAQEPARRRAAERLVARLTRSFPRRTESEKAVVAASGARAMFVRQRDTTLLTVTGADGRPLIQPHVVDAPDAATLAFDPTGTKLAWDETPEAGRRRTRLLDLGRAKLTEVGASVPELLVMPGTAGFARPDRYTSFVAFSPDGAALLVVSEGFLADGTRIPRRHYVCDVEGKQPPKVVEAPFSAPNSIDWARVLVAAAPRV